MQSVTRSWWSRWVHFSMLPVPGYSAILVFCACSVSPTLTGFPVNTPETYSENKIFFAERLSEDTQHDTRLINLEHLFQVDPADTRAGDVIKHNDPLSVVLQGVRLPEDLGSGTRDIAVVLDIHTSVGRGTTQLVAFYQRDVPSGQMLNFNNLLVYADPQWDEANPPYFRLRVLDVKAERNRSTEAILNKVSNLSSQIGGMIPHPAIPIVTTAIDAANLIMSNQQNVVILDYQVQFYGQRQVANAGGAPIGPLVSGQWLVLGRARGQSSSFWETDVHLDRETDRIIAPAPNSTGVPQPPFYNVPVPYVSVVLLKADAEVPKLVLDRSEVLLNLLSTPSGKSDIDAVSLAAENLMSAVDAFAVERRLRKYRSKSDLADIITRLRRDADTRALPENQRTTTPLNTHELRRLVYVLDRATNAETSFSTSKEWVTWWDTNGGQSGRFVESDTAPLGVIWQWGTGGSDSGDAEGTKENKETEDVRDGEAEGSASRLSRGPADRVHNDDGNSDKV